MNLDRSIRVSSGTV